MTVASEKNRVLLVDDEPQLLAGLQIHLRRLYEVHVAQTGADALEILREVGGFAVIVSDMRMPGMNGVEVLRRACSLAPDATRVLLTGYADVESAIGAVNEGKVFRFLTKPCPPPQLLAVVAEAVTAHRELLSERAYARGEQHRVSEKVLKAGRLAAIGSLATGAGQALKTIASEHSDALDTVIAQAASGGFVSAEDLRELRTLEATMFRTARCLTELSADGGACDEIDVRRAANRATEHVRVLDAAAKKIEIVAAYDAGLPAVVASSEQLEQVITNLLKNSVDALAEVKCPGKITVRVRYDRAVDEVVCEVEDNGPGVHPEARPFVMRPYFSTKGERQTGLGLAIAEKLIVAWGGTIGFESTFGAGATFFFRLPSAAKYATTRGEAKNVVEAAAAM